MKTHETYMKLALAEAQEAFEIGEVPVGAVGVYHNEVIAVAHNLRERDQDPLAHAEMAVLAEAARKLGTWRLEELCLYVTLEPCIMCVGALLQARVPRLVFGAMDPKAGAVGSLYDLANDPRLNHQMDVTSGVLAEESGQLLRRFFQNLRD